MDPGINMLTYTEGKFFKAYIFQKLSPIERKGKIRIPLFSIYFPLIQLTLM